MTTFEFNKCGMLVNATSEKYVEILLNSMLEFYNSLAQISKSPNERGKIKSYLMCIIYHTHIIKF